MKFLIILTIFAPAVFIISLILYFGFGGSSKKSPVKRNVRNYKVRFDAAKEKYYLVNELDTHDEPVTNSFGFRVMYKEKAKADFVAQKYNS